MYMRELDALIAVADKGSFLKASQELYVTPASIMHQINKLEGIAGVKLVERTNKGTHLTDAGCSLYEDAKRMIALSGAALRRAQAIGGGAQSVIRIGTSIMRPSGPLIELWNKIDDGSQPVRLEIVPFEDDPNGLSSIFDRADCFVGPCDSVAWRREH